MYKKSEIKYCIKAIKNIIVNTNLKELENTISQNLKVCEKIIFPKKN